MHAAIIGTLLAQFHTYQLTSTQFDLSALKDLFYDHHYFNKDEWQQMVQKASASKIRCGDKLKELLPLLIEINEKSKTSARTTQTISSY